MTSSSNHHHKAVPTLSLRKRWPFLFIEIIVEDQEPGIQMTAVFSNHQTIKGKIKTMELKDNQKVVLTLQPTDAKGQPAAQTAGSVSWAVGDTTIATLSVDADNELQATVVAVAEGTTAVNVSFKDIDGNDVSATTVLTVIAGDATGAKITAGAPTDQETA